MKDRTLQTALILLKRILVDQKGTAGKAATALGMDLLKKANLIKETTHVR